MVTNHSTPASRASSSSIRTGNSPKRPDRVGDFSARGVFSIGCGRIVP
jgi:hypothetical protein